MTVTDDPLATQRAERQLLIAALGPGVQHAANNMLTVLTGTADILRRVAKDEPSVKRADRLTEATQRLEVLIRAYCTLARRPLPQQEPGDLALLVTRLVPLLELVLPRGTKLETVTARELRPVLADWSGMDVAILALLRQEAARIAPVLRIEVGPMEGGAALRIEGLPEDADTAALEAAGARVVERGAALVFALPDAGA